MLLNSCSLLKKWDVFRCIPFLVHRRFFSQSYYDILKVSPNCTSKEIRDAFIHLSKKHHPDKHMNDPSTHEKFVQINEAYSTLINPSKRRAYDVSLHQKRNLNPPYGRPFTDRHSSTYSDTFHSRRQSSYTSGDEKGYYKDPFTWNYEGHYRRSPYPPHRYSNSAVVIGLVAFSIFGAIIQLLFIRKSFQSNHDKMVEKSREYGQIHSMVRERARLYGNDYQLEVLKNNLMPFDVDEDTGQNKSDVDFVEVDLPSPKG